MLCNIIALNETTKQKTTKKRGFSPFLLELDLVFHLFDFRIEGRFDLLGYGRYHRRVGGL